MRELIERIRQCAILLEYKEDSIALDKDLGELECLLHTARQEIDDEWRAARDLSQRFKMSKVQSVDHDSDEIKQLIADLFRENEGGREA